VPDDLVPRRYRDAFPALAMTGPDMIDQVGQGILDIYRRRRFLPPPDRDATGLARRA